MLQRSELFQGSLRLQPEPEHKWSLPDLRMLTINPLHTNPCFLKSSTLGWLAAVVGIFKGLRLGAGNARRQCEKREFPEGSRPSPPPHIAWR